MYTKNLDINRIKTLYWGKGYSIKEVAKELNISFWVLYNLMNKNKIHRRSYSEVNYLVNRNKPRFKIKETLDKEEQELKIAGIMLYWAEGTFTGSTVDFTNSNPQMVKIFLKFLRKVCGINEGRLRVYLYAYYPCDLERIKIYWHNITEIPLSQFTKPYIRTGNPNLSKRKLPYGLVHIRYNDKRLLETIKNWVEEYINNINGGEVAERPIAPDCKKCSVSEKFEIEKQANSGKPRDNSG